MNFNECGRLVASVTIEMLTRTGEVNKRTVHKTCNLTLGRNEFSEIVLSISNGKGDAKYPMKDCKVHSKFASEGKASIRVADPPTLVLLSNCPPDKLILFVKTITTKQGCFTLQKKAVSARHKLLSGEKRTFQEISPLTAKELETVHNIRANQVERSDVFTPKGKGSWKRHRDEDKENVCQKIGTKKQCVLPFKEAKKVPIGMVPVRLTKEQVAVLDVVRAGRNVFFTGSAGTGKSFLTKRIIGMLPPEHTFATASTGVAACHIGGTTLHAFAGIGSGNGTLAHCVELAARPAVMQQWKKCKHLIIDEISMVGGDFFEKLEAVARVIRKRDEVFGGIQLILCGDFLQLPPVYRQGEKRKFAFQTKAWRRAVHVHMELTLVKRQADDKFIDVLRQIRLGRCPSPVADKLRGTSSNLLYKHGIQATRLCTHTDDVNHLNTVELNKLKGDGRQFTAVDSDPEFLKQINHLAPVEQKLTLKLGAQVMLAKNVDVSRGLVNGARGVVSGFEPGETGLPIVKFMSGVEESIRWERWTFKVSSGMYLTRRQLPLKLAWAISIHKSQGMSLDCVEITLSRVFECGQAYVALSRATSMDGLRVLDFDASCVRAHPDVLKFYQEIEEHKSNRQI